MRILLATLVLAVAACSLDPTPVPPATPTSTPTSAPVDVPIAPERDWLDLVRRYKGVSVEALPVETLHPVETVGTTGSFSIVDVSGPSIYDVDATLRLVGEHALWYVVNDLQIAESDLAEAAEQFDAVIFPQIKETFTPSVEVPGKLTILNAEPPELAGYFAASDMLPRSAYRFSNERAMIVMNGALDVGSARYQGTLAHELHHYLAWFGDPTEDTWISEGFAELSASVLDLPAFPFSTYLRSASEISLANWPEDFAIVGAAYSGASLFARYVADRFGEESVHLLVAEQADGPAGVESFLNQVAAPLMFDELLADWLVANLISATEGNLSYDTHPGVVRIPHLLNAGESVETSVQQIGGSYVRVQASGSPVRVTFDGTSTTPLLPVAPHSGESCWWSNRGNNLDSTLTRSIDLTGVAQASLSFWAWYDIEAGFDYGYVAISDDGGATWDALAGEHTTDADPVGSSLGHAYTGHTDGWQHDTLDLTDYAGSPVLLRFNHVTDESLNNAGWCIDDITIPEIGYADDAESDSGWDADGFVRITSRGTDQRFVVRAVTGSGNDADVRTIELDANNDATFLIDEPTVIVVGGLTPKATLPGRFTIAATKP